MVNLNMEVSVMKKSSKKSSRNIDTVSKPDSDAIQREVEKFLSSGNKISVLPPQQTNRIDVVAPKNTAYKNSGISALVLEDFAF